MPNLKEIRTRMESVASTQQITSAMKVVSASKLRKAQNIVSQLRPYSDTLHQIMLNVVEDGVVSRSPYLAVRKPEKILLMVVTSNRGLCGAFNSAVLKAAIQQIEEVYKKNPDFQSVDILCFGKKASEFFAKQAYRIVGNHDDLMEDLSYERFSPIAEEVLLDFKNKTYDRIDMVCNAFVNAVQYNTLVIPKLPYNTENILFSDIPQDHYIYLPTKEDLVHHLIPRSFKVRTFMRFAESLAAEHGARMSSMHKATENAIELQKDLKLRYNKLRQAAITNEIIEITNGANALNR